MKEQKRSVKEVREEYIKLHPPGFFRKQFSSPISELEIESALRELASSQFLAKEITRFHGERALRKDIFVYWLTDTGRSFLLARKK